MSFMKTVFCMPFPWCCMSYRRTRSLLRRNKVCRCYTGRTLVHFVGYFGLAAVEPVSDKRFGHEYRVKGLPLLHEAVRFQMPG